MKENNRPVPIEFGPETNYKIGLPGNSSRERLETAFEGLKHRLLFESLHEAAGPLIHGRIKRAAHEADVLARATAYPLLVFPALFEEKARAASNDDRPEAPFQCREELTICC